MPNETGLMAEILSGLQQNEYESNPWLIASKPILQQQIDYSSIDNPWLAAAAGLGMGLAGGGLYGYGKASSDKEASRLASILADAEKTGNFDLMENEPSLQRHRAALELETNREDRVREAAEEALRKEIRLREESGIRQEQAKFNIERGLPVNGVATSSPLVQALANREPIGPVASGDEYGKMLETPIAQVVEKPQPLASSAAAPALNSDSDDVILEGLKAYDALYAEGLAKMKVANPMLTIDKQNEMAKQYADKESSKRGGWAAIPAADKVTLAKAPALANSMRDLARRIKVRKQTALELHGRAILPSTEEADLMNEAEMLGAASARIFDVGNLTDDERKFYKTLAKGNVFAGSDTVVRRLETVAGYVSKVATDKIRAYNAASTGGLVGLEQHIRNESQKNTAPDVDKFGYKIGQTDATHPGWKYIGNNQWSNE